MSTVGQALGGLVGGIAGFFLGGPMGALYGAQIGLMAGGALDPARLPTIEGPRLNDLTVQFSTYGAVIPRVYGDCTVHGNVLWVEANALRETVTETSQGGGKGGRRKKQKVRKYTYSATFAVGLCRGPVGSLGRIWIGPDLVYAPGEPYEVSFRFYRGRDTQNPDPRMQATLGVDIPAWRGLCYLVFEDLPLARYGNSLAAAQVRVEILNSGDSRPGIRVKELIEAECLLSGTLSRGDLAFEGLDQWVHGYRIGRAGPLRQALEPLRSAWPFDVVQSGYQLVFRERGTLGPVTTIPASDLDARPGGAARGVSLTTRRETAGQLPRRVVVQYLEGPREYEPGEQYAERLVTPGVGERIVELPIVMTADEAAQTAETLLYLAWLEERSELAFTVPASYAQLEPGDRVDLELPQGTIAVRLSAINLTSDGRLECRAAYARRSVYQPGAYGASSGVTGPGVRPPAGPTRYVLLDLPMVLAAQSGPSYLCALYGDLPGWRGGSLMRSPDGGSTWASVFDDGPPGPAVGVVTNVPGIVDARLEDRRSALKVTLLNGALYSVSDGQIDVGGNLFAYGDDGRWEIVSARDCDRVSASDYLLTVLRRGRYGTEWAMAQHQVGDKLVRLDPTDVVLIDTPSAEIGQRYSYRGITYGQDVGSDIDRPFRYVGVNLKPLAPVYLTGSRDSGQGWSLSWVRRTRDGGEWRDFVDAGLGESIESYQVEIYSDAGFTSVRRRIVGSAPWCVYPSADQIADFGAPQSTLHLRVYQLSPVVGPGYALQATLSR